MFRFLLPIFAISVFSCSPQYAPPEKDVKDFFAQWHDSVLTKNTFLLVDSFESATGWSYLFERWTPFKDTVLTSSEIEFIANEMKNTVNATWADSIFEKSKIVSSHYIDSLAKSDTSKSDLLSLKLKHTLAYYKFSLPYFSKDENFCVLYYDYYCSSLCAETSLQLYKKISGRWRFVKSYFREVS